MRRPTMLGALLTLLAIPAAAWAQTPERSPEDLVLRVEDINEAVQFAAALRQATHAGKERTRSFLAAREGDLRKASLRFNDISIAYTAVKFEEWAAKLEPMLDPKAPSSEYRRLIEDGRKQLAALTAPYAKATRNARSALDINKDLVAKNLAAVEELMLNFRSVSAESLPK